MAKHKCPECEEGAPAWMLTFGDMISLILTFFILLVSMMVIDPKKFVEVLGTFQKAQGEGYDKPTVEDPIPSEAYFIQIIRAASRRSERPEGGMLQTVTGEAPVVFSHKENYVVKMADTPFFREFDIMLTDQAKIRIRDLAKNLKGNANRIRLYGHYSKSEANLSERTDLVERVPNSAVRGIKRRFEYFDENLKELREKQVWLNDSRDLAYQRARAVEEYLVSVGVTRLQLTSIGGEMVSDLVEQSDVPQTQMQLPGSGEADRTVKQVPAGTATIHRGAAESMSLETPVVEGIMLRKWPHFIFTESGDDRGRTVEIVVTGELIGSNDRFAPAAAR